MYRGFRLLFAMLLALIAADAQATAPVRFSVVADNRGHTGFVAIAQRIARLPGGAGQFMISTGDEDPVKVTRQQLRAVFRKAFPWYPVVGNHEATVGDEMQYLRQYFASHMAGKVNPGPDGTRETTYSFDAGEVHIAVLNQYWNGKTAPGSDSAAAAEIAKPLLRWLEQDLGSSRKPWKLVASHEPVFFRPDKDLNTARSGTNDTFLNEDWKAFWDALEAQGVTAYLCSHTHRYSRFQPPGSKVWQIDVGQARGDSSWQNDTFVIVTADEKSLRFETYRNLKEKGVFTITDTLTLGTKGSP